MNEDQVTQLVLSVLKPFARNQEHFQTATQETKLWEDLQINSARFIDVLLAFEAQLEMEIDDNQIENVATVGDVVRIIQHFAEQNPEAAERVKKHLEPQSL